MFLERLPIPASEPVGLLCKDCSKSYHPLRQSPPRGAVQTVLLSGPPPQQPPPPTPGSSAVAGAQELATLE